MASQAPPQQQQQPSKAPPPPPPPLPPPQPQQKQQQQLEQQKPQQHQQKPQQLRKPVFVTVDKLYPGTSGHNLVVKVVSTKMVMQRARPNLSNARQVRISESVVGDHTGVIIFTARNEQVDLFEVGATLILRNAKIDMFRGSMRLAVDRWGRIELTEPVDFTVKEDNNLSLVEYELVNVAEKQ